jgi:hypothetical protein
MRTIKYNAWPRAHEQRDVRTLGSLIAGNLSPLIPKGIAHSPEAIRRWKAYNNDYIDRMGYAQRSGAGPQFRPELDETDPEELFDNIEEAKDAIDA